MKYALKIKTLASECIVQFSSVFSKQSAEMPEGTAEWQGKPGCDNLWWITMNKDMNGVPLTPPPTFLFLASLSKSGK